MTKLFSPINIGNLKLKNRIVMSPMCQYSSADGFANDWHKVHYGCRAIGGCAVIIQEATAVSPEGRITYGDLGIWKDKHINKLSEIVQFIKQHGAIPGIQLAHAGRKGSCELPWKGGEQLKEGENHWETVSSSPIPFHEQDNPPHELSEEEIKDIVTQFYEATQRSIKAGYDIIEIHAAHGYLIHQFLSPISNKRTDKYGGSFENRVRFLIEIIDSIKELVSKKHSLWVRISATDWVEHGWTPEDSVQLAAILKEKGVVVLDVSTGGNVRSARIPVKKNYQVPFSEMIRNRTGIMTGAVGLITEARQAELILEREQADLIFLGRQLLRDPYFPIKAAKELGEDITVPFQYERAFR